MSVTMYKHPMQFEKIKAFADIEVGDIAAHSFADKVLRV
jgi:hypothetical protein